MYILKYSTTKKTKKNNMDYIQNNLLLIFQRAIFL